MKQRLSKIRSSLIAHRSSPNPPEHPQINAILQEIFFFCGIFAPVSPPFHPFPSTRLWPPGDDIGLSPNLPAAVSLLSAAEQKELAELLQAGGLHDTDRNRFVVLAVTPVRSSAEQKELNEFEKGIKKALPSGKQPRLRELRYLVELAGVLEKAELRRFAKIKRKPESERTDEEKSLVKDCEKFVELKNKLKRTSAEQRELEELGELLYR